MAFNLCGCGNYEVDTSRRIQYSLGSPHFGLPADGPQCRVGGRVFCGRRRAVSLFSYRVSCRRLLMKGFRVEKEPYLLDQLTPYGGKTVLHIGCVNSPNTADRWQAGTLLHKQLCDKAKKHKARVVGVDIDHECLQFLKEMMSDEEILEVDAHNLHEYFGENRKFDLMIAGDVIEHLSNPGIFLTSCAKVLADDGEIIISTANAFGVTRFVKSLLFHEAVEPDHAAYYSHKTLQRLLAMNGLEITDYGYYQCEPVNAKGNRDRLNRVNLFVSRLIENAACLVWPQYSEGIIIKARKAH